MTDIHFDGESTAYRTARDELLAAELKLIDHVEEVAVLRRNLPPARQMTNDYIFREGPADLSQNAPADMFNTPLSALFGDFDSLILIHLMYSPEAEEPCPLCSMWTDSYDAVVPHVRQHAGFALVAKAPIERVREQRAGNAASAILRQHEHHPDPGELLLIGDRRSRADGASVRLVDPATLGFDAKQQLPVSARLVPAGSLFERHRVGDVAAPHRSNHNAMRLW